MLDTGFDDLIDMGLVTFAHVLEMLREFKREGQSHLTLLRAPPDAAKSPQLVPRAPAFGWHSPLGW